MSVDNLLKFGVVGVVSDGGTVNSMTDIEAVAPLSLLRLNIEKDRFFGGAAVSE
jgi:hypothetical protein